MRPSSSIFRALTWEDTYGDDGEDDVRGRREDDVGVVAAAKRFVAGVVESKWWR